jgi:hypothetical protein
VAQALIFLTAGYKSSTSTMSFALYELSLHPEIQHRLREQILQVLSEHDGKLTYESMQDMSYLDRVVSGEERKQVKQKFDINSSGLNDVNFKILAEQFCDKWASEVKKIPHIVNSKFSQKQCPVHKTYQRNINNVLHGYRMCKVAMECEYCEVLYSLLTGNGKHYEK